VQLELAKKRIEEAGLSDQVQSFAQEDIVNLARIPTASFDVIVCYGGALSYVRDRRHDAASELKRITKPGGLILVSVMSRYGATANLVRRPTVQFLKDLWGRLVWHVLETGDLSGVPSTKVIGHSHPAMHLYTSTELRELFSDCEVVEVAGSNVSATEGAPALEDVASDPQAWATAVELERKLCRQPGLVDSGSHLILVARHRFGDA
jgi:SAM-dependent methyltransferase